MTRELRCNGCGQLVGTTRRDQAVPVQCLDPICPDFPPVRQNEDRDSLIELIAEIGVPTTRIAETFGITRRGVYGVLKRAWPIED